LSTTELIGLVFVGVVELGLHGKHAWKITDQTLKLPEDRKPALPKP
jgi:hypothetical protein